MTFPPASAIRLPDRRESDGSPITLSTHRLGDGPAVVFCHGFPDLAFGWRHQLEPIARAGFRAIAPDQRGYGRSSVPAAIEPMRALCADLELHHVEKVGHWVQQEAPEVVNGHLLAWLSRFRR